jgi:hypothetical protein
METLRRNLCEEQEEPKTELVSLQFARQSARREQERRDVATEGMPIAAR